MITKKEYAKYLIAQFRNDNKIPNEILDEELGSKIFSSSSLAVALQYLGYLDNNKELYDYASQRGGIVCTQAYRNEHGETIVQTLSVREMLDLLPVEDSPIKPYKVVLNNEEEYYIWAESLKELFFKEEFQLKQHLGIKYIEDDIIEIPLKEKRVIYYMFDTDTSPEILNNKTAFYEKIIKEISKHTTDTGKIVVNIGNNVWDLKYKVEEFSIEVVQLIESEIQ